MLPALPPSAFDLTDDRGSTLYNAFIAEGLTAITSIPDDQVLPAALEETAFFKQVIKFDPAHLEQIATLFDYLYSHELFHVALERYGNPLQAFPKALFRVRSAAELPNLIPLFKVLINHKISVPETLCLLYRHLNDEGILSKTLRAGLLEQYKQCSIGPAPLTSDIVILTLYERDNLLQMYEGVIKQDTVEEQKLLHYLTASPSAFAYMRHQSLRISKSCMPSAASTDSDPDMPSSPVTPDSEMDLFDEAAFDPVVTFSRRQLDPIHWIASFGSTESFEQLITVFTEVPHENLGDLLLRDNYFPEFYPDYSRVNFEEYIRRCIEIIQHLPDGYRVPSLKERLINRTFSDALKDKSGEALAQWLTLVKLLEVKDSAIEGVATSPLFILMLKNPARLNRTQQQWVCDHFADFLPANAFARNDFAHYVLQYPHMVRLQRDFHPLWERILGVHYRALKEVKNRFHLMAEEYRSRIMGEEVSTNPRLHPDLAIQIAEKKLLQTIAPPTESGVPRLKLYQSISAFSQNYLLTDVREFFEDWFQARGIIGPAAQSASIIIFVLSTFKKDHVRDSTFRAFYDFFNLEHLDALFKQTCPQLEAYDHSSLVASRWSIEHGLRYRAVTGLVLLVMVQHAFYTNEQLSDNEQLETIAVACYRASALLVNYLQTNEETKWLYSRIAQTTRPIEPLLKVKPIVREAKRTAAEAEEPSLLEKLQLLLAENEVPEYSTDTIGRCFLTIHQLATSTSATAPKDKRVASLARATIREHFSDCTQEETFPPQTKRAKKVTNI